MPAPTSSRWRLPAILVAVTALVVLGCRDSIRSGISSFTDHASTQARVWELTDVVRHRDDGISSTVTYWFQVDGRDFRNTAKLAYVPKDYLTIQYRIGDPTINNPGIHLAGGFALFWSGLLLAIGNVLAVIGWRFLTRPSTSESDLAPSDLVPGGR